MPEAGKGFPYGLILAAVVVIGTGWVQWCGGGADARRAPAGAGAAAPTEDNGCLSVGISCGARWPGI